MRDGGAEGPGLGAFGIDVDPLVVAGGVGKLVDVLLRHLVPVGDGDFLARQGRQFVEGVEGFHARNLAPPAARGCPPRDCPAQSPSSHWQMPCHCARSRCTRPGATSKMVSPRAAR